jgi:hypothetical protein
MDTDTKVVYNTHSLAIQISFITNLAEITIETQSMREIRLLRGRLPRKGGGLTGMHA